MGTQTGERQQNRATIVANTIAVLVPAMWIGGVPFASQVTFAILACAAAWTTLSPPNCGLRGSRGVPESARLSLRLPKGLLFIAILSIVTTIWVIPMPPSFHGFFLPKLTALRAELLPPEMLLEWTPISLAPGQTLAEAARVGALGLLFYSCRQTSHVSVWYAVLLSGSTVAIIGLVQFILGFDQVLGIYAPVDQPPAEFRPVDVLMGTFVNPNHQAGYFLITVGAGAALIRRSLTHVGDARALTDRRLSSIAIVSVLVSLTSVALMLTYSRAAMVMLGVLILISVSSIITSRTLKTSSAAALGIPVIVLLTLFALSRVDFSVSWSELATLASAPASNDKIAFLSEHQNLLHFSHAIGLGRGTAGDLIPLTSSPPSGRTLTHIESMPIVLILEYGVLAGGALLIVVFAWFVREFRRQRDAASMIILAALAALCCQNFVDFNLEFSGVAASAIALASTVSPANVVLIKRSKARRWVAACVLGVLSLLALSASQGGSWASQRELVSRVQSGSIELHEALRRHPFDARLHLHAARAAVKSGDVGVAKRAAETARRLEPGAIEAHLIAAQIEQRHGNNRAARSAYKAALSQIAFPPPPELVAYLTRVLDTEALAAVAPDEDEAFFMLANSLLEKHPRHVLSITRNRAFQANPDAEALVLRIRAATQLDESLLATTEALHLVRIRPAEPRAYRLYARAIRTTPSAARERDFQSILRKVLERPKLEDKHIFTLLLLESALLSRDVALVRSILERLKVTPHPNALNDRKSIRWKTQLVQRAENLMKKALTENPVQANRVPGISSAPEGERP